MSNSGWSLDQFLSFFPNGILSFPGEFYYWYMPWRQCRLYCMGWNNSHILILWSSVSSLLTWRHAYFHSCCSILLLWKSFTPEIWVTVGRQVPRCRWQVEAIREPADAAFLPGAFSNTVTPTHWASSTCLTCGCLACALGILRVLHSVASETNWN